MSGSPFDFRPLTDSQIKRFCGNVHDPDAIAEYLSRSDHPVFEFSGHNLVGTARETGVACLWKPVEALEGIPFEYGRQTIGDCTGWAAMHAMMCLSAVQIRLKNTPERWHGPIATEPIYGFGRVEVGGGKIRGDGCVGAWIAEALKRFGVLLRKAYGPDELNLTRYSGTRARRWGARGRGVPDRLEPHASENLLRTASLVTSFDQAADCIASGYPVMVCSDQGFANETDADGFAEPHGTWHHAMAFVGVDVRHRRPGLLCKNSWGPHWIRQRGRRHDQPPGSFWVEARVCDRMLRQNASFAYSGFHGFPRQDLLDFSAIEV